MSDTTKDAVQLTDEQIRDIENDQAKMPGATRENLTVRTVRAALIAQHGFCQDEDQCTCAREIGYRVCQPSPAQVQAEKDAKTAELHKMLANIMHDQTTAMQSALIEWKHGKGAEAGLHWIVNTLMGPGLLPDFDAEHGTNAQFWFDANQSQPMPKCFCGNPSHIGWMGQGFCSNAHYNEAKAKHDAAPSTGDQS